MYTHIHPHAHAYAHAHTYTCMHVYTHICTCTCTCTCTYMHTRTCTCTCTCTYTRTHAQMHTHWVFFLDRTQRMLCRPRRNMKIGFYSGVALRCISTAFQKWSDTTQHKHHNYLEPTLSFTTHVRTCTCTYHCRTSHHHCADGPTHIEHQTWSSLPPAMGKEHNAMMQSCLNIEQNNNKNKFKMY